MKVYTKTGDLGDTALYGGQRVSKSDIKIDSYGNVDELNSSIGVVISLLNEKKLLLETIEQLHEIQEILFDIGAHLAKQFGKEKLVLPEIKEEYINILEQQIDKWTEELPELKFFILPGGNIIAAHTHIARTVCRRAERSAVLLSHQEPVESILIKYLNRLSDYLFVLSRYINFISKSDEIIWLGRLRK
ncbi:MAG: cob(I)yrinic acid a,c-diamide adenosyltransferase [Chitinophagales bacterium]